MRIAFLRALRLLILIAVVEIVALFSSSFGQVYSVTATSGTGSGSLYSAIQQANNYGNGAIITIANNLGTINVGQLPDIDVGLTINGGTGNTLSGQNTNRIFFINAPSDAVQISNLTLSNGFAQGGSGGAGGGAGGGGAGLGGAVFINSGSVSFSSDVFTNNSAVGGAGGAAGIGGGGGGGGLAFNGGEGNNSGMLSGGGGGGGGARTSGGANGLSVSGGAGGGANGAAGGSSGIVTPNGSSATLPDGGGGGGGGDQSSPGSGINGGNGGNGSDFGAGGGGGRSLNSNSGAGGNGGFGAGGGGGADAATDEAGPGGNGGFGGGGGGGGGTPNVGLYGASIPGSGGFGGGSGGFGNQGAGGGGAAFGGAVFIRSSNGAQASFSDTTFDVGSVTGGAGGGSALSHNGANGQAAGSALFLMGGNTAFSVSLGKTLTIAGSIAESSSSSITITGAGMLQLTANNAATDGYSGGTTISSGGTLGISSDNALGAASGGISLNGGTLQIQGTSDTSTARTISIGESGGTLDIDNAANTFVPSTITGNGSLTKTGAGALSVSVPNTYGAATLVNGGTLVIEGSFIPAATTGTITVNNSGTLMLGDALLLNNVLGVSTSSIATLDINAGGTVTTYAGTAHNLATVNLAGGTMAGDPHPLSGYSDYTLNETVSADATAGISTISAVGGINLRGAITFDVSSGSGELLVSAPIHNEPSAAAGAITKTGPGLLVLSGTSNYSGVTTVNAGMLAVDGTISGNLNVGAGGTIGGNGQIGGTLTVSNEGILAPGDALGLLTAQSLALGETSQTNVELGGITRSTQYDSIVTTSGMQLAGTLNVSLVNGFIPVAGTSFNLFDWGSLSGTFTTVNVPSMNGRIVWDTSQLYTTGTISVVATYLAGDFNRDGHVNAADILAMEQALTNLPGYETAKGLTNQQLLLIGDINGGGVVNNADLQALLNLLKSGDGSTNPVPEPASLVLLAAGSLMLLLRRNRALFVRTPDNCQNSRCA